MGKATICDCCGKVSTATTATTMRRVTLTPDGIVDAETLTLQHSRSAPPKLIDLCVSCLERMGKAWELCKVSKFS